MMANVNGDSSYLECKRGCFCLNLSFEVGVHILRPVGVARTRFFAYSVYQEFGQA